MRFTPVMVFFLKMLRFAEILEDHKITFIGPTAEHIRLMGDKIIAKETVQKLGIPVVPGSDGAVTCLEDGQKAAEDIGYPVLIKAASGGGGRGMQVAQREADLKEAMSTARAESKAAFGDDTLYMEKYLQQPRHIEVQAIGDGQGHGVHLGERDCSLQRRHQKVWEEAPSPALNEAEREKNWRYCCQCDRHIKLPRCRHD